MPQLPVEDEVSTKDNAGKPQTKKKIQPAKQHTQAESSRRQVSSQWKKQGLNHSELCHLRQSPRVDSSMKRETRCWYEGVRTYTGTARTSYSVFFIVTLEEKSLAFVSLFLFHLPVSAENPLSPRLSPFPSCLLQRPVCMRCLLLLLPPPPHLVVRGSMRGIRSAAEDEVRQTIQNLARDLRSWTGKNRTPQSASPHRRSATFSQTSRPTRTPSPQLSADVATGGHTSTAKNSDDCVGRTDRSLYIHGHRHKLIDIQTLTCEGEVNNLCMSERMTTSSGRHAASTRVHGVSTEVYPRL